MTQMALAVVSVEYHTKYCSFKSLDGSDLLPLFHGRRVNGSQYVGAGTNRRSGAFLTLPLLHIDMTPSCPHSTEAVASKVARVSREACNATQ